MQQVTTEMREKRINNVEKINREKYRKKNLVLKYVKTLYINKILFELLIFRIHFKTVSNIPVTTKLAG